MAGCSLPVRARGFCSKHEQRFCKDSQFELPATAVRSERKCQVEGCDNPTGSGRKSLCEAHYMRFRRKGTFNLYQHKEFLEHTHGYILQYTPDHPLRSGKSGSYEYQHRVVFYDHHGDGPFQCYWCGITVSWSDMHVDHLNATRDDNRLSNLVASCARCNQKRGQAKMRRTARNNGRLLTAFGKTQCISEWAQQTGIGRTTIAWRIDRGWTAEQALSTGGRRKALLH